jgi:HSP20 family molecular chaperone IbpA
MSLFPRADGFAPIFRLLDDYDAHRSGRGHRDHPAFSNFTPRFDVRESTDAYLLDGEIPGMSPKDVDIEFSDHQTLVIKGRVTREYSSGNEDTTPSTSSPKPTPTVEDATDEGESSQVAVRKSKKASTPQYKFWVSERSFGEFHRSFSFPTRVDQDAVKATFKNGVLSVVIPKAPHPAARKITIE